MKSYAYSAFTAEGKRKSGTIVAEDEADASRRLSREGYIAEAITVQTEKPGTEWAGRRRRLDNDMQALFARQMAVLLAAGLPVDEALDVIRNADGGRASEQVSSRARALVMEGVPLSEALDKGGSGFPAYVISAIRAGEASRDLTSVLEAVAEHLETRRTDRAALATALIYPAFVAATSLIVCAILMATVAPQLAEMFEATGRPLPQLTTVMLGAWNWIAENAIPLAFGAGLVVVGIPLALRRPAIRDRWHETLLQLPIVGRLMRLEAANQYLRTLALVVGSRQPVIEGIRTARDVLTISRFRDESDRAIKAVEGGASLSSALSHTSFVPPVARQMVEAGEKSARVATTTERAAILVETWLTNDRRRIAALLDPLLMILIGVFVLVIVASVLLPIFDLQGAIAP